MRRLHLKRKLLDVEASPSTSKASPTPEIIDISNDDSDTCEAQVITDSDEANTSAASVININSDEDTILKFHVSTDSVQSDDDVGEPVFNVEYKTSPSMFRWDPPKVKSNRTNVDKFIHSEFTDEINKLSKAFYKEQEYTMPGSSKRIKDINTQRTKTDSIPQVKIRQDSIPEVKIRQDSIPQVKIRQDSIPEVKIHQDSIPDVEIHYTELIAGVRVKLPVKPYSCQLAVMNKVIQGCRKREHCLLESPTGTGKTLALLCASLAWHDHHIAEIQKNPDVGFYGGGDLKLPTTSSGKGERCSGAEPQWFDAQEYKNGNFEDNSSGIRQKIKIPKIFYGTRTHKQIEQVVRELRKTCYKHKKMTILSSREHSCIQDTTKNKTELCNELLDPAKRTSCPYYNERNRKALSSFPLVQARGLSSVWDIEEFVKIGKNAGLCPYFGARNLVDFADIIFCPYNYIVDPDIRESMQLDIKEHVIILDEAHNIEDICREVASVNFRVDELATAAEECENLKKQRTADFNTYNTLHTYILSLMQFIKGIVLNIHDANTNTKSSPYWTGEELQELLNVHKLGEPMCTTFLDACRSAIMDSNNAKDDSRMNPDKESLNPIISQSTKIIIEHLMFAMRMIRSPEYTNDYRACVIECDAKVNKYALQNTWYSRDRAECRMRTLKLMCMNPGVTFVPLAQAARCIILASGTLTPTASFQSELNTPFVHILNAGHVISKEQVYAAPIARGPTGKFLRANFKNVNSWSFQDELGWIILDTFESVPHGIICFFSSYTVMHTQIERWKRNSIFDKISSVKQVFIEPRNGSELDKVMNEYRQIIKDTAAGPLDKINGAVLFAVFRGKVAEGIDFKDDEARCVITVGIPYAVKSNPVIEMKMKYNDIYRNRGLLSGSHWYCIQAFRALNQALGRCVRHINDWGAVLLIDERFLLTANQNNLPKWIKTMWVSRDNYCLREDLSEFVARQRAREMKM